MPECDRFNDYRRQICRGEQPHLSREKVNYYRAAWGMPPLPDGDDYQEMEAAVSLPQAPPSLPSLVQRVVTFATALTRHVCDGLTKCDDSEIQARLECCQQCPSFTGLHCRECGCCASGDNTFLNKLAWRSETCPLGKW
jgi:hypothetical protein